MNVEIPYLQEHIAPSESLLKSTQYHKHNVSKIAYPLFFIKITYFRRIVTLFLTALGYFYIRKGYVVVILFLPIFS